MRIGSKEAREAARLILESPEYQASLKARAAAGTLPAALEVMLWHYRYGKPPDKIEVEVKDEDLTRYSASELKARAEELAMDMAHIQKISEMVLEKPN